MDFDSWALSKPIHQLIIPETGFQNNETIFTAVFMEFSAKSAYEFTAASIEKGRCVDDCYINGYCYEGTCHCQSTNRGGQNCMLVVNEFTMTTTHSFSQSEGQWRFFKLYIAENYQSIVFSATKATGDPFIFIKREAASLNELPSMFDADSYMYFGSLESEFDHSYSGNSEDYWLISTYCHSSSCNYSLKISYEQ